MTTTEQRPTLNWEGKAEDGSAVTYQMAFGYLNNEPTAMLFVGDHLSIIPRDILIEAYTNGWANKEKK
jgi:hypothetical protein|tara:strand:- start:1378 stop:1581 length:204 start_codon:yes stop_codon:yes gene_type:complete